MKKNQITIRNKSKSKVTMNAVKAINDFLFNDYLDRKNFLIFNDYLFVDKYFSDTNKKLTIELSDRIEYRCTSSNDTFTEIVNEINSDGLLDNVLSCCEDPLINDIYKEIEDRKIIINKSNKKIDKKKSEKLLDKIIQSFLNRKIKYPISGCFQVVRNNYYKIVIYYKTVKNNAFFTDNIKSILSHELFHFNHCLSFDDDAKWLRSLDTNFQYSILANIVVEGLATHYQLEYEKIINAKLYYDDYRFYSSFNMFNFFYSGFHMYDILSKYNDLVLRYVNISSKSFNRSFSESYSKLFQGRINVDQIARRCLRMED